MMTARFWIHAVRIFFYSLAIMCLLLPFAVLFVIDPEDPNHLTRFIVFPLLAVGFAIFGKLISTGLEALLVYIQKNRVSGEAS